MGIDMKNEARLKNVGLKSRFKGSDKKICDGAKE